MMEYLIRIYDITKPVLIMQNLNKIVATLFNLYICVYSFFFRYLLILFSFLLERESTLKDENLFLWGAKSFLWE